ncbi:MAG TPA: ABC transporter permease [Virgibacillus sp.]|nr:ABC transporter permease [Virgibacillus sp.]
MRIMVLTKRVLRQIIRDKRTLALLLFAPILVLTMLHLVFDGETYQPKIGLVDIPEPILKQMDKKGADIETYHVEETANEDLKSENLDGYIVFQEQSPKIKLEGSDPSINRSTVDWIRKTFQATQHDQDDTLEFTVEYLHGSGDMGQFDYFGPVLLGFFIFFFVFLIAGVSFIKERTSGTLERLLASPLRKWEIITGYVCGFGVFTMIQATVIAAYAIFVLGMLMEGAFIYVLIISLALALTALTLGILISSFANNTLQMVQFIPIIVVPQIFFSGLFNLDTISDWLSWIGPFTPLYYAAEALRNIMVRGYGWNAIYQDVYILIGFSVLFMFLNLLALRKYRKI